jgi:integrase
LRNAKVEHREGTFSALIADFKAIRFGKLRPQTRRGYTHCLNRLEAMCGDRQVAALTRRDIYALLDQMKETPTAANYMLSVLRTIIEFGVPRGYRDDNPAIGVKRIDIEDNGHKPWLDDVYNYVLANAPTHLRRMVFLGRATGQRVSDLVRMRPADLAEDGINLRIGKLRDKPHMVPLTKAQMSEICSWGVRDLEPFITTPRAGKRFSARYLERLWRSWRDEHEPIRAAADSIHGLRATKIHDLRKAGTPDGAIADEIGMSVKMVSRYLRFADKVASARASRDRRERKMTEFENFKAG